MLRPRIIPCLLIKNKGLVKTINFNQEKYIGDPINAVRIFNEKQADELIVLDIAASTNNTEPNFKMIETIAAESQMPLCYGGGIKNITQAREIISLGVEKIAISSAIHENPDLTQQISQELGNQSVVAVLDIKYHPLIRKYRIHTKNGKINTKKCPLEVAQNLQRQGVGEIVLNSIDRDGTMNGYDMNLVTSIFNSVQIPITVLGGAGSLLDIVKLTNTFGTIGAAAGSLFIYNGPYKAVLINYPSASEKTQFSNQSVKETS